MDDIIGDASKWIFLVINLEIEDTYMLSTNFITLLNGCLRKNNLKTCSNVHSIVLHYLT